jgi:hypothetical protein
MAERPASVWTASVLAASVLAASVRSGSRPVASPLTASAGMAEWAE